MELINNITALEKLSKINFNFPLKSFRCVYSLGTRCYTEKWIKDLGMRQFSSIFGSINMHNVTNLNKCLRNLSLLTDEKFLIHANGKTGLFDDIVAKRGARTFHTEFDNINNYEDATFAHHDLSSSSHREHFERAVQRFNSLLLNEVPTLFVCVPDKITLEEYYNLIEFFDNKNSYVLTIQFNSVETKLFKSCKKGSLFYIQNIPDNAPFNKMDVIKHLLCPVADKNLLTLEEIDSMSSG